MADRRVRHLVVVARGLLLTALVALAPALAQAAGRVFYDGFESGTTSQWSQDSYRNRCTVVTAATDGGPGPTGTRMLRCNWNGTVQWNDPASYEALVLDSWPYSGEFLVRARVRTDANLYPWANTGPKWFRIGADGESYCAFTSGPGTNCAIYSSGGLLGGTYWGDAANPIAGGQWHTFELYIRSHASTGELKLWVDDVLVHSVANANTTPGNGSWNPFYVSSNWSGGAGCCDHDTTNHFYWDEFEVFSDVGAGGTGSMSAGTMTHGGGGSLAAPGSPKAERIR